MAGEPQNGGWTFGTLLTHVMTLFELERSHLRDLLEASDKRYEQRFQSSQKALDVTQNDLTVYKASQNEWRGVMADKDRSYITRNEHDALVEKVGICVTRTEAIAIIATVATIVGVLIEVLNFSMFQHK